MIAIGLRTVLLPCLFWWYTEAAETSPCIPDYFRYVLNEQTNEFNGRIEIPSPPRGIPLHLSVSLSIATALPTKYVGRLKLAQSREQSVKAIEQGWPLKYDVLFPLPEPVPTLTGIWFNDQLICAGRRAIGQIMTSIVLNHTLYPPGVSLLSVNGGDIVPKLPNVADPPPQSISQTPNEFQTPPEQTSSIFIPTPPPTRPTIPNTRPTVRPPPPPPPTQPTPPPFQPNPFRPTIDEATEQYCGRSNVTKINYLIAGGTPTVHGQWPWLAAIYILLVPQYEFWCAGSLVTNTHVITAAHCTMYENISIPVGAMEVALGRYQLKNFEEKGSVNRQVARYKIHPDYKHQTGDRRTVNGDADLAVMILATRVEYNTLIRPICLWAGPTRLDHVVGRVGTVVGWGRDEFGNRYLERPRMIHAPIVSQETCLRSTNEFLYITSNRTFCAGTRNKTGPCNGDSGSGFMLYESKANRYYLRGVVSLSLRDGSSLSCDLNQYVVYTDVAQYLGWIHQQLST